MLLGGFRNKNLCYSFSVSSGHMTNLQHLRSPRLYHGSAVIGNSVFLVGGYKNRTIEKYDIDTKIFTCVSLMKRSLFESAIPHCNFGICIYRGDSLLIAGGYDSKCKMTKNCFVFDTKTKAIRDVGSLKTKRSGNALVNFKEEIFCIGGHDLTCLNSIEKFDAATEKWKTSNLKLNVARSNHQAFAHKQFIYVIGGKIESYKCTDSIERIDVSAGRVEELNVKLKHARSVFAASKVNNSLYIFGGQYRDSYSLMSSTEVLNLDTLEIKEGVELPIADYGLTACSI